jgi:hypothetical protein
MNVTIAIEGLATSRSWQPWGSRLRGPNQPLLDSGNPWRCTTNWPVNTIATSLWVESVGVSHDLEVVTFTPFLRVVPGAQQQINNN